MSVIHIPKMRTKTLPTISVHFHSEIMEECYQNRYIRKLDLKIFGHQTDIFLSCSKSYATLADLVPTARILSDLVVNSVIKTNNKHGVHLPCKKGCCYCCYYFVPISVAEAYKMQQELESMPSLKRTSFLELILNTAEKITTAGMSVKEAFIINPEVKNVSEWYKQLKLPCPFLFNSACSIYGIRPIPCREYIITGSPLACRTDSNVPAKKLELPVSIAEVLTHISNKLDDSFEGSMILPIALIWAIDNKYIKPRSWPAKYLLDVFIEEIQKDISRRKEQHELYHRKIVDVC